MVKRKKRIKNSEVVMKRNRIRHTNPICLIGQNNMQLKEHLTPLMNQNSGEIISFDTGEKSSIYET